MNDTRIIELAQTHPDQFMRGVSMGTFVARMNTEQPLSADPERDAMQVAGMAAVALASSRVSSPDQIDAIVQGCFSGVEVVFSKLQRSTTA